MGVAPRRVPHVPTGEKMTEKEKDLMLYWNDFQWMLDYVLGSRLPEKDHRFFTCMQSYLDDYKTLVDEDQKTLREKFAGMYVPPNSYP